MAPSPSCGVGCRARPGTTALWQRCLTQITEVNSYANPVVGRRVTGREEDLVPSSLSLSFFLSLRGKEREGTKERNYA